MARHKTATDSTDAEQLSTDKVTGEVRDSDGLLVDEYSDDSLENHASIDALDVPSTHLSKSQLEALSAATDASKLRQLAAAVRQLLNTLPSPLGDSS